MPPSLSPHPNIAATAGLIADPARAAILIALMDGRARPAGELASRAGVTAQTASAHLGKLLAGGFLIVIVQGRHRYYRIADPAIVAALEALGAIDQKPQHRRVPHPEAAALCFARCCYDHLAGRLGVAVTQHLVASAYIEHGPGKAFCVTPTGTDWFSAFGLDPARLKPGRHGIAHHCLDWTEREFHLAGPLGTGFMARLSDLHWVRRTPDSRVVTVTPTGYTGFKEALGLDPSALSVKPS